MKPDGGPAFPVVPAHHPTTGVGGGPFQISSAGMTLRDYFAAAALQGMLAAWPVGQRPLSFEAAAAGAYHYADEMLAEREKP